MTFVGFVVVCLATVSGVAVALLRYPGGIRLRLSCIREGTLWLIE